MVTEKPNIRIFQDFSPELSAEIPVLNAFIVGPQYDFLDYSDEDDKEKAFVGEYDKTESTDYDVPELDPAAILDEESVEVIFDDVEAEYFSYEAGSALHDFNLVSGKKNQIRSNAALDANELIFKEYTNVDGTTFERSSVFLSRDVAVGDGIEVSALGDTLRTKVSGFVNEVIPAVVSAAVANAGNQGTVGHSVGAAAADPDNTGNDTLTFAGTYVGSLAQDVLTDTYTLEVVTGGANPVFGLAVAGGGNTGDASVPTVSGSYNSIYNDTYTLTVSTGGASGVAQITVTSTNGDSSGPTTVSTTVAFNVGTLGVQATYATFGTDTVLTAGDTWTIAVTASAARLKVTSLSGTDDVAVVPFRKFGVAAPLGTRGVTFSIADGGGGVITAGDKWTTAVVKAVGAVTATSGGTYTGTNDKTYTVEVVQGGLYGSARISITSTSVDSSGPTIVTAHSTAISVGTQGVTVSFASNTQGGLVLGDKWTIPVTAARKGAYKTLILQDNLPASVLGAPSTDLDVRLFLPVQDLEISRYRLDVPGDPAWSVDSDTITIEDAIYIAHSSWFDDAGEVLIPVDKARVHVVYRALRTEEAGERGTIDSTDPDAIAARLGRDDPRNPLSFAVHRAAENSANVPIKFQAIRTDDRAGYQGVWAQAKDYNDVYTFVPLTQAALVHQDLMAHVTAMSTPELGLWRIGLINHELIDSTDVYSSRIDSDGEEADYTMTVVDNPEVAGTQYNYLIADDGQDVNFIVDNIVAGDYVRLNFRMDADGELVWDEIEIEEVISSTVLVLADELDAAISTSAKFQVFKVLDKTAQATAMATYAQSYGNRRIYMIWPDQVGIDGTFVEGYYLAAAIAGMIAALPPHQGFTNFEIIGFDDLSRTFIYFTADQQQIMADGGIYLVTQSALGTVPFARHQLSTDTTAIEFAELSITKNIDNISYFYRSLLLPLIGVYNVTPDTLEVIYASIMAGSETLKNNVFPRIGGQLIDATITDLQQDETFCTKVRVDMDITIPCPLNQLDFHLVI